MPKISPIIQPQELLQLHHTDYILIDASAGSRARYDQDHLAGALYINLDTDLADIKPNAANGGRHPLPTVQQFSEVLGKFGINPDSHVIIYDDKNASNAAARFWWMLRAIGHEKVQVLNGGFEATKKAGFPSNGEKVEPKIVGNYQLTVSNWQLPLTEIKEVESLSKSADEMIIDVRSKERFDGLTEPIDLVAGHIPGATNIPFTANLDQNGFFLAPEILKSKYEKALTNKTAARITVHCGSGVTACHTLLAIDYAGLPIPKLYVGSWSEWSRNEKEMVLAKR